MCKASRFVVLFAFLFLLSTVPILARPEPPEPGLDLLVVARKYDAFLTFSGLTVQQVEEGHVLVLGLTRTGGITAIDKVILTASPDERALYSFAPVAAEAPPPPKAGQDGDGTGGADPPSWRDVLATHVSFAGHPVGEATSQLTVKASFHATLDEAVTADELAAALAQATVLVGAAPVDAAGQPVLAGSAPIPRAARSLTLVRDLDGDGTIDDELTCGPEDRDADGLPDLCDPCAADKSNDGDGDGLCSDLDRCAEGPDHLDGDLDGTPDACAGEPGVQCEELVYIDDGGFMFEGQPYQLKGVNFTVGIGATAQLVSGQWQFEYFAAPNGNYRPQNYSVPWTTWQNQAQGCLDAASCRQMLIDEHIPQLLALGVNSVRLTGMGLSFDANAQPFKGCQTVYVAGQSPPPCRMDMTDPAMRARLIGIVRDLVELLGSYGIRTIYLTSGFNPERPGAHAYNLVWLEELSQAFRNQPYLLAYDPYNEPLYAYDEGGDDPVFDDPSLCAYTTGGFCKGTIQAVTKSWFDALTAHDPHHLVTLGLGTAFNSPFKWDPWVVYDHFTSYHVYPQRGEWDDGGPLHNSRYMANQLYYASLSGCGEPCPYLGQYDGANCLVGAAAVGQQGFIWGDGYFYPPRNGGNPCPNGWYDGPDCKIGEYEPGRDQPFWLNAPIYYVVAQNGTCPPGTWYDGANCVVATAPPGANAFIYTVPGAGTNFYYEYLDPNGERCRPPAYDDGANCKVAPVPSGWDPFFLYQTLFYVKAVECGPAKPLHLGETGFSSYPHGVDLNPTSWVTQKAEDDGELCTINLPPGAPPADGPVSEQIDYLLGDLTQDWEGMAPFGEACGFQGLHWWQMADVKWGACRENNFGLFTYWWKRLPTDGGDFTKMVPKDTVSRFAADVDFLAPSPLACDKPYDYYDTLDRRTLNPNYTHVGRVLDHNGSPVANAVVRSWEHTGANGWRGLYHAFTDADGVYSFTTEFCIVSIEATRVGYTQDHEWTGFLTGTQCAPTGSTLSLPDLVIEPFPAQFDPARPDLPVLPDPADLQTPDRRRTACKVGSDWIILP